MLLQYNEHAQLRGKNLYKKYPHDAGWDICTPKKFTLEGKKSTIVHTGLHICVPKGLKGLIRSRSGHGLISQLEASNAGVIDYGFTGECKVRIYNNAHLPKTFEEGARVAQIVFDTSLTVRRWDWVKLHWRLFLTGIPQVIPEVPLAQWPATDRGNNGYGSTGA